MSSSSDIRPARCPSCRSSRLRVFFDLPNAPIHVNFLCDSEEAALNCVRGDIQLAHCSECGLIHNVAFDADRLRYKEGYENSLHYSSVFQGYAEWLADRLIREFQLKSKTILEIGCGDGQFLRMLCERGDNRGVGFDPSHVGSTERPTDDRIRFVKDLYTEKYSDIEFDFILSRQTLEHVHRPSDMLVPLRRSIGDRLDAPVFFEVPNGLFTLRRLFIWDIIYEHACYYTAPALETTFARAGFRVESTFEAFDGQYVCITAYPGTEGLRESLDPEAGRMLESQIDVFESEYAGYVEDWRQRLNDLTKKTVVLWGAGSKGVTFLNTFDLREHITHVVDVNPKKHGMFVAGQGQRIVPPAYLADHPVDTVIVANSIYKNEILELTGELGLAPEFVYL